MFFGKTDILKVSSVVFVFFWIVAAGYLTKEIIGNSRVYQAKKQDYAVLNDVKYGLFSIEVWKQHITSILSAEIDRFNLSNSNERKLKKHIKKVLGQMIDKVAKKLKKENNEKSGGWLRQAFTDMFVNIEDIKKGIPEYADAVIKELTKPKTKAQMRSFLNDRLKEFATETADLHDRSELVGIYRETRTDDIESARQKISQEISDHGNRLKVHTVLLIVLSMTIYAVSLFRRTALNGSHFWILLATLMFLLMAGVTTPMIDMEAKISKLSFTLIGYPVTFENQVLYFQSKSILDVFWIMIVHPDFQMKVVGILLILFSVFFPVLKLASLVVHYYNLRGMKASRMVQFFVFKSGKWSMTDVMVVAIFMAYIGFNGVIDSQLGNLGALRPEIDVVTTNGTALQPGYYLFLTFALLALVFSEILERNASTQKVRATS